jgi:hypothetical protein
MTRQSTLACLALGVLAAGCGDTTAPDAATHDALAAVHGLPTEWVGTQHNEAMRAIAAQLRATGATGGTPVSLCARLAQANASAGAACTAAAARQSADGSGSLYRGAAATSAATPYAAEIADAMLAAQSPGGLAVTIVPIVRDAEADLPPNEAALIEATASVAQNSLEHWTTDFYDFSAAVTVAYGDCFARTLRLGYDDDTVIAACLAGTPLPAAAVQAPELPRGVQLTRSLLSTPPRYCGLTLSGGMAGIGWADLEGGFVGGVTGIPGGPETMFGGALLGAIGASSFTAGKNAYYAWRCAMNV